MIFLHIYHTKHYNFVWMVLLMEMNMQNYIAFFKTVECGSFTKASEVLGYSQSAISRMIADLESEWDVTLLERSKGGVRLTSDGLRLLPHARALCRTFDDLQRQAEELSDLESGLIRIGTFSSVATHWLPNIIREFQKDYPNIEYELLLGDYKEIETWIHTGRVDCGFLRLPTHPDFDTIFLERDPFLAILPQGHPLAHLDPFPLEALCREPFMLLEKGAKAEVIPIFRENGLQPDIRFTTWDDYAVMSMVENGLGLSILPRLILRRVPYRILKRELEVPVFRDIGLALRDREAAPLSVKRFLDYLSFRNETKPKNET